MSRGQAVLAALFAASLFGTIGTVRVLGPEVSSWTVTWARCAFALVILIGVLLVQGNAGELKVAARTPAVYLAALSQAFFQVGFMTAVVLTGVAVATLITIGTVPLFAGLVSGKLSRTWFLATALSVTGAGLLVTSGSETEIDPIGVGLAVMAGAAYGGLYLGSLERIAHHVSAIPAVAAIFGLVSALVLPGMLMAGDLSALATPTGFAMVAWLSVASTAVAYVLVSKAVAHLSPAAVSTLALAEPPVATLLAVLILGEQLTPTGIVGSLMVVAGLVVLSRAAAKQPGSETVTGEAAELAMTDVLAFEGGQGAADPEISTQAAGPDRTERVL